MSLREIASLFIAVSELAPQSMRILVSRPVRWKQVLNRPPEPKASPQPTNCSCMDGPRGVDVMALRASFGSLPPTNERVCDGGHTQGQFAATVRGGQIPVLSSFFYL